MVKHNGKVEIRDSSKNTTITLDGNTGKIYCGGNGKDGEILLNNATGNIRIFFDAKNGNIHVKDSANNDLIVFRTDITDLARLRMGGTSGDGQVVVRNKPNDKSFIANPDSLFINRKDGTNLYPLLSFLTENEAHLFIGNKDNPGSISVRDGASNGVFHFDGNNAALYIGANGNEGDIFVRNSTGDTTFHIDGNEGDIRVFRKIGGTNREVMTFDASHAALYVGSQGNEGDIIVKDDAGRNVFHFDGNNAALYIGANGNEGDIIVRDGSGNDRIHLDGNSGDIKLYGADCAEEFEIADSGIIDPGTTLVINCNGKLSPCEQAYDKKVAGVVSGGLNLHPGIILGKKSTSNQRLPVALSGRVYCKVDAHYNPIQVGDLLTTSPTLGYAMKATDSHLAFGAVIGKALESLEKGKGLIPILVGLQ